MPLLAASLLLACAGSGPAEPEKPAQTAQQEPSLPLYARATVALVMPRPRQLVDLPATPNDPNAMTSWWPVMGSATFTTTSDGGVDIAVVLKGCRTAYLYPVKLYEGECTTLQAGAPTWDGARGELSKSGFCFGSSGAMLDLTRQHTDPKPWSIGGPASSNVLGRTLAVLDASTGEPLACGKIQRDGDGLAHPPSAAELPAPLVVAQLAGACLPFGAIFGKRDPPCPDPMKLGACSLVHCVGRCLSECAASIACLSASNMMCDPACLYDQDCTACLGGGQCEFSFCREVFACAPPPTPNGPCTQLRACCMRQGPLAASCIEYVKILEDLSGDASCLGAFGDWDFNTNYAYISPCSGDMPATL